MGAGARDRDKPPGERMLACLSKPGLTGREARVLAALAYHDGRGGCWPSDDTIARGAGVGHRSAVVEARKGLHRKGWLRWKRGQHVNRYEIAYGEPFAFNVPVEDGALSGKHDSGGPVSGKHDSADGPLSGKRDSGNAPLSGERDSGGGALSGKRDSENGASSGAGRADAQLGLALHGAQPAAEPPPAAPRPPERGPPLSGKRDSAEPAAGGGGDNVGNSCAQRDGGDAPLSRRDPSLSGERDTNRTVTGKEKTSHARAGNGPLSRSPDTGKGIPDYVLDAMAPDQRAIILRRRKKLTESAPAGVPAGDREPSMKGDEP